MFYNSDYGRIFDFLVRVREMKKDIDMLLLKNKLTEVGILERLG
jgi:replicative DNA helicase